MDQPERIHIYGDSARISVKPTVEQLLRGDEPSVWSSTSPPSSSPWKEHDPEEDHSNHQKKSVLTKVKEKARKLRYTLSNKKKHAEGEDENTTPSWGVSLDDEEEDAEFLGAPKLAPEDYKETLRQHPRADPVISEKHLLPSTGKNEQEKTIIEAEAAEAEHQTHKPISTERTLSETIVATPSDPYKTIAESITEKLAPAYATVSDATHAIASKIQSITGSASETPKPFSTPDVPNTLLAPVTVQTGTHEQTWDKGVSVKEYFIHKFEPGEDERALSQVISEAMSPKKTGVMEKVREAMASLLLPAEPSLSEVIRSAANSSSDFPISSNPHEVSDKENRGRMLQPN